MNLIVGLSLALVIQTGGSQQATPLTLDQAVQIAVNNSFTVRTATSNVEIFRQRVNQSRGQLGPKVSIGATYTRFEEEQVAQFGAGSPPVVTQPIDTKVANASVTLPIDISGNLTRNVRASQANLRASQQTLEAQRNQVKLDARRAYFEVLRADALVNVNQQALADAQERLKNIRLQVEAGAKAEVEAIRQEAQVSQSESDLLTSQNQAQLARESFNNILARPIETPVVLVDIQDLPPVSRSADELNAAAQSIRPEIRSLEATREALAYTRRAQEAGMNPTLGLSLSYQRNIDAQGLSSSDHTASGALALNIPVFDSGITRARVKEARQNEEQALIQLQQTKLGISLEVRQALTNLTNARSRLEVANSQVRSAEENLRIAALRSQAGQGIALELIDAQTALTQARNLQVAARYDYLEAYSALQKAIGNDDVNTPPTTPTNGAEGKKE